MKIFTGTITAVLVLSAFAFTVKATPHRDLRSTNVAAIHQHAEVSASRALTEPNLEPHKPSAWSDKIVLSNRTGTHTDTTILAGDNVYIDWAVVNRNSDITTRFYTSLYVDNSLHTRWITDSLQANYYIYVTDYNVGALAPGTHTIEIRADSGYDIAEQYELDNIFRKSFFVEPNNNTMNIRTTGTGAGSVAINPPGISCESDCSREYSGDTLVTLTAAATAESVFTGWSGDCSGTAPCQLAMNGTRSVSANFDTDASPPFPWEMFLPAILTPRECSSDRINFCFDPASCQNAGGHWWSKQCNSAKSPSQVFMGQLAGDVHFTYDMFGVTWNEYYAFAADSVEETESENGYFQISGTDAYGNKVTVREYASGLAPQSNYFFINAGFPSLEERFVFHWEEDSKLDGNIRVRDKDGGDWEDYPHADLTGIHSQ